MMRNFRQRVYQLGIDAALSMPLGATPSEERLTVSWRRMSFIKISGLVSRPQCAVARARVADVVDDDEFMHEWTRVSESP